MISRNSLLFTLAMSSFLLFSEPLVSEQLENLNHMSKKGGEHKDSHHDSHHQKLKKEENVFASYRSGTVQFLNSATNPNVVFEIEDINEGDGIKTFDNAIFHVSEEGYYHISFGVAGELPDNAPASVEGFGFNLIRVRKGQESTKAAIGGTLSSANEIFSSSSSIILHLKHHDKIKLAIQDTGHGELSPGSLPNNLTNVAYITFVKLNKNSLEIKE